MSRNYTRYHIIKWDEETDEVLVFASTVRTKRKALRILKNHPTALMMRLHNTPSTGKYYGKYYGTDANTRSKRILRRLYRKFRKLDRQEKREK